MRYAHKQTWLKLLLLQIDIIQYGQVAQHYVLYQLSKVNGLQKKNMKKMELKSFIENAYENIHFFNFDKIQFLCFQILPKRLKGIRSFSNLRILSMLCVMNSRLKLKSSFLLYNNIFFN